MKKFRVILCALICVFGLTACGSEDKVLSQDKAAKLESRTQQFVMNFMTTLSDEEAQELCDVYGAEGMSMIVEQYMGYPADGNGLISAFSSWSKAKPDLGEIVAITGASASYDDQGRDIIVLLNVQGTMKTAQIEAIYEDDLYNTLDGVTTNVDWTFGEKMGKAGLNTLMGMGTVFVILILISLIISLFKFIPKIQEAFSKDKKKDAKAEAVDNTIAQIVEKEELTDDLELIAVITAAIAASGTSGSSDDYVVRSIRRRPNSQWNKA